MVFRAGITGDSGLPDVVPGFDCPDVGLVDDLVGVADPVAVDADPAVDEDTAFTTLLPRPANI